MSLFLWGHTSLKANACPLLKPKRFGPTPFLLPERNTYKGARFILSQPCFPGWLGPGASLLCIPATAGAGAATYAGTITLHEAFLLPPE